MPDQLPLADVLCDDGNIYGGMSSTVSRSSPFGPEGPKPIAYIQGDILRDDGNIYSGLSSTVSCSSPFVPEGPKPIAFIENGAERPPSDSTYEPKPESLDFDTLQVLFEKKAFSRSKLISTIDILRGISGPDIPDDKSVRLNAARRTLKLEGLIETVKGRHGGCWLTAKGRALAERLFTITGRTFS